MPPARRQSTDSDAESATSALSRDHDADGSATTSVLTKSLVRLAIASEYSRTPIRRSDITTHVLAPHNAPSKMFKPVFDAAQHSLRQIFGMELVELPAREKVTLAARRREATTLAREGRAKRAVGRPGNDDDVEMGGTQSGTNTPGGPGSASSAQKSWVLVSVLPDKFHTAETRLGPGKAPTEEAEATYAGLCTLIVTLIALSGGSLAQGKLDRHLRRADAEHSMPIDRTDKVLARMIKEGYIHKSKENTGGEELIEYYIGPRGKVEIGQAGISGLVRMAYGESSSNNDEDKVELERRLERSLRVAGLNSATGQETTI